MGSLDPREPPCQRPSTAATTVQYTGCSDVIQSDSINGSHVVGEFVQLYNRNWEIIVYRLSDVDQQRYIHKFMLLGIDKCPYARQARSQDFTLGGGAQKLRRCTFFSKS